MSLAFLKDLECNNGAFELFCSTAAGGIAPLAQRAVGSLTRAQIAPALSRPSPGRSCGVVVSERTRVLVMESGQAGWGQ